MWTPGYWAYGQDGYYWVPGAWVPAPYAGALWTPGYWGWASGLYVFHPGYWGYHVGYYGGVNYGFGYGGIGFAGGLWRGGVFSYNTAVMHVGVGGGWGGHVYEDRVAVDRGFVARDSHVAFSGGPGGIQHQPTADERVAEHEQHTAPTSFQSQHESSARADRTSYSKFNGGHPSNLAVSRPLPVESHPAPAASHAIGSQPGGAGAGGSHASAPATAYHSNANPGGTAGASHAATSSYSTQSHTVTQSHTTTTTTTHANTAAPKAAPKPRPEGHEK